VSHFSVKSNNEGTLSLSVMSYERGILERSDLSTETLLSATGTFYLLNSFLSFFFKCNFMGPFEMITYNFVLVGVKSYLKWDHYFKGFFSFSFAQSSDFIGRTKVCIETLKLISFFLR